MSDAVLDVGRNVGTAAGSAQSELPSVLYDQWTLQKLAPLASQHHMSEYNRLKYGRQGCPVSYAPLSLHLPHVVRSLREHQERYADKVLWWPCTTPVSKESRPLLIPAVKQRAALAAGGSIPHLELQLELSKALSEPITVQPQPQLSRRRSASNIDTPLHIKTSETHPINISPIVPPESLVAISAHLTPCKRPCPVMFEIHLPHSLDRIAGHPQVQLFPSRVDLPITSISSTPVSAVLPSISQHKRLSSNDHRSSVTGALNAALNTKLSLSPMPVPSSKILLSFKRNIKSCIVSDAASGSDAADAAPKLTAHHSTSSPTLTMSHAPQSRRPSMLTLPDTYALHPSSSHIRPPTAPSPPSKISKFRASRSPSTASSRQGMPFQKPFKLGNLLLSSCPGKKVRLGGHARGRSAVCRDLHADLRRMKIHGARCVVCCLDDEELEFLIGASWAEYCRVAHLEGLDVLRIPLPEGLVPLSPKSLDADLDRIIERYTLHGISVLVHCRGGVGRAGLLACCWMLKLGLCGWIETDISLNSTTTRSVNKPTRDNVSSGCFRWNSDTVVRRDTLQLVERAIEVVRRRRSVKAIETLEQVQFLVEYVDYLRTCERVGGQPGES